MWSGVRRTARTAATPVTRPPLGPASGPAEWTFPADPGAVRTARAVVGETLRNWQLDEVSDLTVLLVSELVTNALRYASGPIGVRLRQVPPGPDPRALLVEVSDPLPEPPQVRPSGPLAEGGRGLQLVAGSSRRWGTKPGRTGKTVWFELQLGG
jgi:anti-sigma regulatory factor (Ser/Thr protein kinase)